MLSQKETPKEKNLKQWSELGYSFQTYLRWILASIIDAVFLGLWVFIQWKTNIYISDKKLEGIDLYLFRFLQVILGISSLVPIISKIFCDSILIIKDAKEIMTVKKT